MTGHGKVYETIEGKKPMNKLICECSNSVFEKIREEVHEYEIRIVVRCLYCSKDSYVSMIFTSKHEQIQSLTQEGVRVKKGMKSEGANPSTFNKE